MYQNIAMQEVTSKVATYFKLTFSQYQTDEERKNFRKIFMCRHVPHEERDSTLRQQVVDAPACHT